MTEFKSAMQKMQYEALVELIHKYNSIASKINASLGDAESLANSIREGEEFADIRNQIAQLQEQLEAAVKEKVDAALANVSEDTTEAQAELKEIEGILRPGLTYYKKLYGNESVEDLPKQTRLKSTRSGGGGGGGRRIRGYNVVVRLDQDDNTTQEFENFAGAAKFLDVVTTADLQEQFFAKAGVEKIKDAPDVVEFSFSWNDVDEDGNETPRFAEVRAYRTGPSGPPTTTKDEDVEAVEVDEDDLENI